MISDQKNHIPFLRFPNLSKYPHIRHGIFTRNGGYSIPPYHQLNVSFGIGDTLDAVRQNRLEIFRCMGEKDLVFLKQVHGTRVILVPRLEPGNESRGGFRTRPYPSDTICTDKNNFLNPAVMEGDAVITNMPDKNLVIQVADCQAILVYDPVKQVVANIHSGWRGSISNIIGRTLDAMKAEFGCKPGHMAAGIGPSLGPCCAEFVHYQHEIPEKFWKYKDPCHHFDFWNISKMQLEEAGVLPENICAANICTRCHSDLFFSYRKEKTTGRFAAVIGLK